MGAGAQAEHEEGSPNASYRTSGASVSGHPAIRNGSRSAPRLSNLLSGQPRMHKLQFPNLWSCKIRLNVIHDRQSTEDCDTSRHGI